MLGYLLIRSVKREIEQRERIEKLAGELEETNERQETPIHFIGHEVKGSLTKDSGTFAELLEGDFGQLPDTLKPLVEHALAESRQGAASVENILKAANLKKGTVTYTKESFDLKALVAEQVEKAKSGAERKGLTLSFTADESSYQMTGDKAQIGDHVLRNIIENSINYTPSGSVTVSLKKENGKLVLQYGIPALESRRKIRNASSPRAPWQGLAEGKRALHRLRPLHREEHRSCARRRHPRRERGAQARARPSSLSSQ